MEVVYISGAYRASCEYDVLVNIRKAEEAAILAWSEGFVVICPHKNTAFFGGAMGMSDNVWIEGDLELVRRCDILWAIDGWEASEGSKMEIEEARANNVRVVHSFVELQYIKNPYNRAIWDENHNFPYIRES